MEWFIKLITGLLSALFPKKPTAEDQKIIQQQEALETARRVREAETGPHGPEITEKRLDDGKF